MIRRIVKLLGQKVDTFTFNEAVEHAKFSNGQIVTINPEMIENARVNPEFSKIINEAQLIVPDGIGVKIGLLFKGKNAPRIAGIELGMALMKAMPQSVALIGAKPEILEKAARNVYIEVDNINIVYTQDGYFTDEQKVIDDLCKIKPRLILVALGSPKQEKFIYKLKSLLPNSIMIGLGGSFDVWAGEVERAPEFFQYVGLEWLYRTIKQPERFKRIFPTLPNFLLHVIAEVFTAPKKEKK